MIGKTIQGYEIIEVRDAGAMGVVYKAKDPDLPRVVAIKVMNRALVDDEVFLERFRIEAQALAMVQSPNIVTVHRLIDTDDELAIVMEFVDGKSMQELSESESLSWERVAKLIRQVLAGLAKAHAVGIVHRDIKPSNVLVLADDTVKIVDFGLAKSEQLGRNLTQTGTSAGTLYYMSPEQIRGFRSVGPSSDLYSVGMTFYRVLCGRLPFDTTGSSYDILKEIVEGEFETADVIDPTLPASLVQFLARSIEKQATDRFASADEMIEVLDGILADPARALPAPDTAREVGEETRVAVSSSPEKEVSEPISAPLSIESATEGVFEEGARPRGSFLQYRPVWLLASAAVLVLVAVLLRTILDSEESGPPPSAVLEIVTDPPGAEISLGGERVGFSPISGWSSPAGSATLRASLNGFLDRDSLLTLVPDQKFRVEWSLVPTAPDTAAVSEEPQTAIELTIVPWGQAFFGGTQVGGERITSELFVVDPGAVRVRIWHPDFGTWEKSVAVADGESVPIRVDFTRLIPVVVTSVTDDGQYVMGEIIVDGKSTGSTTPKEIRLRVGRHSIEVRQAGYVSDPIRIDLFGTLSDPIKMTLRKE